MFLTNSAIADMLLIAIICLIGCQSYWLFKQRRWMVLDPLNAFWAGIFICYIEQPITGSGSFISWYSEEVFVRTLFVTLFGVVFLVIGYEMNWGKFLARKIPKPPSHLNSSKLLLASLVMIGIGLIGYAYVIELSGGLVRWLSVGRGNTDYEVVKGYAPELMQALPAGVALLLFRANLHRVSKPEKIFAWVAAAAMTWWFLYLGTRSRLIAFLIVMLAAYFLPRRRNPHLVLVVLILIVLQITVRFQASYRSYFTDLSFNTHLIDKQEMWKEILPVYLGGDSELQLQMLSPGSELGCAMAVVNLVPERVPFNYGYGLLQILTGPIPRSIWPSKIYPHLESVQGVLRLGGLSSAVNTSVENQDLLMGPAFAFVGSWYYMLGYIGMMIGGLFVGVLLRTIRSYYDLGRRNESIVIVYPFLVGIGFAEAASTPLFWVYSLPFVLLPLVGIFYLCRDAGAVRRTPMKRLKSQELRS